MALPIAHAAAGYLVRRAARRVLPADRSLAEAWRRAAVFMVVGNLPDLDFLVGFVLGRPGMLHRGLSHTIFAAAVFGLAAGALAWRRREPFGWAALAYGAAYGSHLLLDWLTIDTRPPLGGQFLWPLSDAYLISPITIFTEMYLDGQTRAGFLATVLAWPTLLALLREAVMVGALVGVWHLVETVRERVAATSGGLVHEDLV